MSCVKFIDAHFYDVSTISTALIDLRGMVLLSSILDDGQIAIAFTDFTIHL